MEQQTFVKQIAYLSAAYSIEVSKETAAVYWHQLGGLPDEPFVDAVQQHVAHSRYFPRVSELRESAQTVMRRAITAQPVAKLTRDTHDREKAKAALAEIRRQCGWQS